MVPSRNLTCKHSHCLRHECLQVWTFINSCGPDPSHWEAACWGQVGWGDLFQWEPRHVYHSICTAGPLSCFEQRMTVCKPPAFKAALRAWTSCTEQGFERPCRALLLLSKFGLGLSTVHNATQYLISFVKQWWSTRPRSAIRNFQSNCINVHCTCHWWCFQQQSPDPNKCKRLINRIWLTPGSAISCRLCLH